jgi:hypothetical protein
MFGSLAHEYFHALIQAGNIPPMPNDVTEEATAYALSSCIYVVMGASVYSFDFFPPKGASVPSPHPNQAELRRYADSDLATAKGKMLNSLNVDAFLGKEKIGRHAYRDKNKLLGLCRAMIQHPHDLTESYYPAEQVKPISYFSTGSDSRKIRISARR